MTLTRKTFVIDPGAVRLVPRTPNEVQSRSSSGKTRTAIQRQRANHNTALTRNAEVEPLPLYPELETNTYAVPRPWWSKLRPEQSHEHALAWLRTAFAHFFSQQLATDVDFKKIDQQLEQSLSGDLAAVASIAILSSPLLPRPRADMNWDPNSLIRGRLREFLHLQQEAQNAGGFRSSRRARKPSYAATQLAVRTFDRILSKPSTSFDMQRQELAKHKTQAEAFLRQHEKPNDVDSIESGLFSILSFLEIAEQHPENLREIFPLVTTAEKIAAISSPKAEAITRQHLPRAAALLLPVAALLGYQRPKLSSLEKHFLQWPVIGPHKTKANRLEMDSDRQATDILVHHLVQQQDTDTQSAEYGGVYGSVFFTGLFLIALDRVLDRDADSPPISRDTHRLAETAFAAAFAYLQEHVGKAAKAELSTYLLRMGMLAVGLRVPENFHAHHVVPRELAADVRLGRFLTTIGFDVEDGRYNGLPLPNRSDHSEAEYQNAAIHAGYHAQYTRDMRSFLEQLCEQTEKAEVKAGSVSAHTWALQQLHAHIAQTKRDLMSGRISLN